VAWKQFDFYIEAEYVRDIQRGPFAQLTWNRVTISGYWFNPGSTEQVFVGMIGVTF